MANCHIHENTAVASDLLVVHHIKPQAFGGADEPDNRVMLCASCHDVLHKAEHKLSKGKKGEAFDIIDRFLPNQTARQQRLRGLVTAVATARKSWRQPNNEVPDAQAKEADTIIVQLDVPAWLHHRLKTAAQDQQVGLYRLCLKVLEQHILKLNDMTVESKATVAAPVVPEVKLIAPRAKVRPIQVWNVLDKADAFELAMKLMAAGSKQRYRDVVEKALKLSPLPRHLEDQEFTQDDAVGLLSSLFDKLKKAQSRELDELYACVLVLVLKDHPVVVKLKAEMQHYKYTKWLLNLFDAA